MQRNPIQQGGHPPPRQQGNGRRPHVLNLPWGQNAAQIQGMNIPPEVQMNQRGIPRRNQDWRGLGGAPQRPVHQGNRNIPFGHNIPQGPLRGQNQAPRQALVINMGPPQVPHLPMPGYGPVKVPARHLPRRQLIRPYPWPQRHGEEYDPNMTLEEALNGGFNAETIDQQTHGQPNRSGVDNNGIPRNTGYGADTRISWSQSNLVPDVVTRRRE